MASRLNVDATRALASKRRKGEGSASARSLSLGTPVAATNLVRSLFFLPVVFLLLVPALLTPAGCSGADGSGELGPTADASTDGGIDPSSDAGSATDLVGALGARGLTVGKGSFEFLDLSACCSTSCLGNNPTSPYGAFFVPAAPGEPVAPGARPDGLSSTFRLRADEAIVFLGNTPPEVKYFGFTPYVADRAKEGGGRRLVAASVAETLNNLVIAVDAPPSEPVFGKRTAIIAAADRRTVQAVSESLVASGLPASAINTLVFDPALGRFGLDEPADTFGVLFRMAVPKDAAARDAFLGAPGASVLRVTPLAPGSSDPLPSPAARPKNTTASELALTSAVDALEAAIRAANSARVITAMPVDTGVPDPAACLAGSAVCAYDNRDTTYPGTQPRILFTDDNDFYIAFGVDHQAASKVSYANVSVYALEHLVGLVSVSSDKYAGSAQQYLKDSPDAPKLYAWKIARRCNGEPFCLEVPKGTCPTGIDDNKLGTITFRTYLEPSTKTAPDPSTLVRDRVLRFR